MHMYVYICIYVCIYTQVHHVYIIHSWLNTRGVHTRHKCSAAFSCLSVIFTAHVLSETLAAEQAVGPPSSYYYRYPL